jgi:hypothetical protein
MLESLGCETYSAFHSGSTLPLKMHFKIACPYSKVLDIYKPDVYSRYIYRRLIIYCFTSLLSIFHLYGDITIVGEGLQILGLCSALSAFEQGRIFIV